MKCTGGENESGVDVMSSKCFFDQNIVQKVTFIYKVQLEVANFRNA